MANVLILSYSYLSRDPRVEREIVYFLNRGDIVTTAALSPSNFSNVEHIPIKPIPFKRAALILNLLRMTNLYYWSRKSIRTLYYALKNRNFDLIIANDILTLPIAIHTRKHAKVILDAHEYAPREQEERFSWRLLMQPLITSLCKEYIPQVDLMFTVCQSIADEYERLFGVKAELLNNAGPYRALTPKKTDENEIKLIYHGIGNPSRRIDLLLDIFSRLDPRFTLDIILVPGDEKYIQEIKRLAKGMPRLRFPSPVPLDEIPSLCNRYDVGIYPLLPINLNYQYGLPNKLFEFIQGRIAVAVSPLVEMERVVKSTNCGAVAEDFSPAAFAKMLNALSAKEIDRMKEASDRAAQLYTSENNFKLFDKKIASLLKQSRSAPTPLPSAAKASPKARPLLSTILGG